MKKTFKIILLSFLCVAIAFICFLLYAMQVTDSYSIKEEKLIHLEYTVNIYDANGNIVDEQSQGRSVVSYTEIPKHVINAFISIEDKRFFSHNGVDYKALMRAMVNNIKSGSFKEGASTITQQLVKNTHLTSEKTLKRKFIEAKLAYQLEKKYSKQEIIEKYLNTIYFGENCYGITKASRYYFDKEVHELGLSEGALLAGIIKAPSNYSPIKNSQRCLERRNVVLKEMLSQGYINESEYSLAKNQPLSISESTSKYDYFYLVKKELNSFLDKHPYSFKNLSVHTYYNQTQQTFLENAISENNYNNSAILMTKTNKVTAFSSNCGIPERQLGSSLKPIISYAPAVELNTVNACSIIDDIKTDFNGYSPSNYSNKYYGKISVRDSLAKSSNVCSAKLLSMVGIKNSLQYAQKTDIPFSDSDENLSLALGATTKGATLEQITASYSTFSNKGVYNSPKCISKITNEGWRVLYQDKPNEVRIFGEDTAFIMNDILKTVVKNGTAKKLSYVCNEICAKTGTVGTANGNSDAYCISYNPDYTMGVWYGNKTTLMPNYLSGGALPTTVSAKIWESVLQNYNPNKFFDSDYIIKADIDKQSYEQDYVVELAHENTPKRYVIEEIFKKNNLPKTISSRYSTPKIDSVKTFVKNNCFQVELCLTQLFNARIFMNCDNKKTLVFDTKTGGNLYANYLEYGKNYIFTAIPYLQVDQKEIEGKEIILSKIKMPTKNVGNDSWWID